MLERIAMQFKKPTGFWGKIIAGLMVKGNRQNYITLIKNFGIKDNDKILEIGYGPGVGINMILGKYNNCTLYGVDFSELMFKKASNYNLQFINDNRVKLFFGDFIETDIKVKGFDKIYFTNVVYFWDDIIKPFEKIYSLLREEGILSFYMIKKEDFKKFKVAQNEVFNKYSIEIITDTLKSAGFKEIEYFYDKGYYIKAKK